MTILLAKSPPLASGNESHDHMSRPTRTVAALAAGNLDAAAVGFGHALDVLSGRGMDELAGWAFGRLGPRRPAAW